jgi:asparagine synthase (glutamine-hydrolysing)
MCGILGIIAEPGQTPGIARADILAMRDRMAPRGPDGCGLFERRNVVLAHRRLAIRDANGGAQPWVSDDGQCLLVYNGEIYNDGSLKRELCSLGHHFRTHCDTEVVMAAYRQWGRRCVHHLRGMFAFGIYDFRDHSLFLARDRFGIKPLYFTEQNRRLVFASSIAALLRHPAVAPSPNLPVISHYLSTFRITLGAETFYTGIRQLLPGEILEWRDGRIRTERYWNHPAEEDRSLPFADAAGALESLLHEAVHLRLVSDVPVGMFLSGGVDSNTIACLARAATPGRITGYCGGSDGASPDFDSARHCARHAGFDYDEVSVSASDYLARWQWMLEQNAVPLSTPTDVILFELARRAKQSVGVVLGGEGADELLCGYAVAHWAGYDYDRQQQLVHGRWPASAAAARVFRRSLRRQYGRDAFDSQAEHYLAANSLIPSEIKSALFQPGVWREVDEDRRHSDYYRGLFEELGDVPTARKHAVVLHRVNLEGLLSRLDSSTMLAGLEARVPFTDHHLVEAMFRVPLHHKIDLCDGESPAHWASADLEQRGSLRAKRILRTVADRLMPAALARRKKASFPTPVAAWMAGPWKKWVRHRLLHSPFGKALFQERTLQELAGHIPEMGLRLWPLLNVLAWGDRQFAGQE